MMLSLDFYYSTPIDFEYKNYILLDYLSDIDHSFSIRVLSPYLLYTEKLIKELDNFKLSLNLFNNKYKKDIIGISEAKIIYSCISVPEKLNEIIEIIDYSKPILESKISIGYKLYQKYPQLLF